jgi:hypothetical protein
MQITLLTEDPEFRVILNSFSCLWRSVLPKPLELVDQIRTALACRRGRLRAVRTAQYTGRLVTGHGPRGQASVMDQLGGYAFGPPVIAAVD